jgi:hypothetical protein
LTLELLGTVFLEETPHKIFGPFGRDQPIILMCRFNKSSDKCSAARWRFVECLASVFVPSAVLAIKVPRAASIDTLLVESCCISTWSSSCFSPAADAPPRAPAVLILHQANKKKIFGLPPISVRFGQTEVASDLKSEVHTADFCKCIFFGDLFYIYSNYKFRHQAVHSKFQKTVRDFYFVFTADLTDSRYAQDRNKRRNNEKEGERRWRRKI